MTPREHAGRASASGENVRDHITRSGTVAGSNAATVSRARWCEAAASWTSIRRGEPHISRDSIPFSETRDWMHCHLGTPDEDLARRDAFSAKSLKRATRRIKDSQMCWARSL